MGTLLKALAPHPGTIILGCMIRGTGSMVALGIFVAIYLFICSAHYDLYKRLERGGE